MKFSCFWVRVFGPGALLKSWCGQTQLGHVGTLSQTPIIDSLHHFIIKSQIKIFPQQERRISLGGFIFYAENVNMLFHYTKSQGRTPKFLILKGFFSLFEDTTPASALTLSVLPCPKMKNLQHTKPEENPKPAHIPKLPGDDLEMPHFPVFVGRISSPRALGEVWIFHYCTAPASAQASCQQSQQTGTFWSPSTAPHFVFKLSSNNICFGEIPFFKKIIFVFPQSCGCPFGN